MNKTYITTDYGNYTLFEDDTNKIVRSENYNYNFNKNTGLFARWGKTLNDDPDFIPFGVEIADIEITTSCAGPDSLTGKPNPCPFCYKSNTPNGSNMSFETFKNLFDKLPPTLTQIAFGADATLKANPDIWKIFNYCRENGVIPNITVANLDDITAERLSKLAGAVAVSRYSNKDWCYDTIKRLVDNGMTQVNIHMMVSEESYERCLETIFDYHTDPRLKGMNAIVFLGLKQAGRGKKFHPLSFDKFKRMIDVALDNDVRIGFDSCSAGKFLNAVKDRPNYKTLEQHSEKCESSLMSSYFNYEGKYFPCSFAEDKFEGIDVIQSNDFLKDVWNNPKTLEFREKLLKNCRDCPLYNI